MQSGSRNLEQSYIVLACLNFRRAMSQFEKVQPKFFNFVVCNPCQSSPSLPILVSFFIIIISFVFFYLCKVLFSGFLQFKGNFCDGQSNSNWAPSNLSIFSSKIIKLLTTDITNKLRQTWQFCILNQMVFLQCDCSPLLSCL